MCRRSIIAEDVGLAGAKRGDNVLAGNYLTTGRAAICTTHISAFGLFQFDVEMLTEWTVRVLAPLPLQFSCFSLCHAILSCSLGHVCKDVEFRQAHMGTGGMIN